MLVSAGLALGATAKLEEVARLDLSELVIGKGLVRRGLSRAFTLLRGRRTRAISLLLAFPLSFAFPLCPSSAPLERLGASSSPSVSKQGAQPCFFRSAEGRYVGRDN